VGILESRQPQPTTGLLAPGTELKVISRKRKGKVTEVVMEEVGRALS
jgi:hypothetical protein